MIERLEAAGWTKIEKQRKDWAGDTTPCPGLHFVRGNETIDDMDLRQQITIVPDHLSQWNTLPMREPSTYEYRRGWELVKVGTLDEIVEIATLPQYSTTTTVVRDVNGMGFDIINVIIKDVKR